MVEQLHPGDRVIVRTYGGYPRIRRFWATDGDACIVSEDQWFDLLAEGDYRAAVAVPKEDVFRFTDSVRLDPKHPFDGWNSLKGIGG